MYPKFLTYPDIGSFSVMWLLGFGAAYALNRWRAVKTGLPGLHVDNLTLLILIMAPVGARFVSRVFYMPKLTFWQALKLWEGGGLVFYGGLIAGILGGIIYCRMRRISILKVADVMAPGLVLGLAIGRIGCFLAGCCWGDLCVEPSRVAAISDPVKLHQVFTLPSLSPAGFPLAVQFPPRAGASLQHQKLGLTPAGNKSLPVHPAQLYEAVLALLLALGLHFKLKAPKLPGDTFWIMGMAYALIRFPIEFLRGDNPPIYSGFTISQVISLMIGLTCLAFFVGMRWRAKTEILAERAATTSA